MFKFTKDEKTQIAQSVSDLAEARADLDNASHEYNQAVQDAYAVLEESIGAYNAKLEDARSVLTDIHSQAESDFSDKSEKWQEGDKGTATQEWIDTLSEALDWFNDIDMPSEPEELSIDDLITGDDPAEVLEGLASEPET